MANVAGTPEYAVALDGDIANVKVGSDADETAPLPHELSSTAKPAASRRVAPRPMILFIFTKTPSPVLRQHRNNIGKVLASIGILSKRADGNIIRAR